MDNAVNGRFHPGWLPDLNTSVSPDLYLNQAGATYCLAKSARYFGDERYLMKARQAILSLLADTQVDAADPACRTTSLPAMMANRTAAAGLLLMAIHELPNPAEQLLKQSDELCQYIRKQQQPDGSLRCNEGVGDGAANLESSQTYAGLALYGLLLSARDRQAAWKLKIVEQALPYYQAQWKSAPSMELAAGMTPVFAEAYTQTHARAFSQFVFEMSDWVCSLQYGTDSGHPTWVGGFKSLERGNQIMSQPTVLAAANLESLAHACLVTRHVPDAARYAKYREAIDLGLQFLSGVQYTDANTLHFTPGYRTILIGGFHRSLQDGTLRLDYQQHAVNAMIDRLTLVGDR
jgi:hypothetical protein